MHNGAFTYLRNLHPDLLLTFQLFSTIVLNVSNAIKNYIISLNTSCTTGSLFRKGGYSTSTRCDPFRLLAPIVRSLHSTLTRIFARLAVQAGSREHARDRGGDSYATCGESAPTTEFSPFTLYESSSWKHLRQGNLTKEMFIARERIWSHLQVARYTCRRCS